MKVITDLGQLEGLIGEHLGYSSYKKVDQKSIQLFADATGDHQWIHVDKQKAADGPFGTTIAHGYLTLSLIPVLMAEVLRFENVSMGVNMGCNKVRFTAPVPEGSMMRAGATLAKVKNIKGIYELAFDVILEIKGGKKPVCVAQIVTRMYP